MKYILILCVLLSTCFDISLAVAQQQNIKFVELKSVPKDVLSQMPKEAKSLRLGTMQIGPKNTSVLFHIYNLGSEPVKRNDSYTDDVQINRLALFRRTRHAGKSKLVKLSTVAIDSFNDINPAKGLMYGQWLDTKTNRFPVLILQGHGGGGFGGIWFTFVFANGIDKPPVIQQFDYYTNIGHGGGYAAFDKVDERGFMMVVATEYESGIEPSPSDVSRETRLYWNGKKFAPRAVPARDKSD
jgi:hypothetical protein